MGRPLAPLLIFLAISLVAVHLMYDDGLPVVAQNVSLGTEHSESTIEITDNRTAEDLLRTAATCFYPVISNWVTDQGYICNLRDELRSQFGDNKVISAVVSFTDGLTSFIDMMVRLMAFDFPCDQENPSFADDCPPAFIEYPFVVVIVGLTSYIVVSLVRGAG